LKFFVVQNGPFIFSQVWPEFVHFGADMDHRTLVFAHIDGDSRHQGGLTLQIA